MQDPSCLARALGHEHRLRLLAALGAGAATVADLADRLNLPQPRVSTHLALLRQAGLIVGEVAGRQRLYRLAGDKVRNGLHGLGVVPEAFQASRPPSQQAAREVRLDTPLRQGRTCYDHLAGVAGVALLDEMLRRGWLEVVKPGVRPDYGLTNEGAAGFHALDVGVAGRSGARRRFAYGCPDWTERRYHLGGALGAALLRRLQDVNLVRRSKEGRVARVRDGLVDWLDSATVV